MKAQAFKSLIKEAVKEAIQEELKEVLLEAVRAPRQTVSESLPKISQSQPSQPINLPSGTLGMDQIMGLMNKK